MPAPAAIMRVLLPIAIENGPAVFDFAQKFGAQGRKWAQEAYDKAMGLKKDQKLQTTGQKMAQKGLDQYKNQQKNGSKPPDSEMKMLDAKPVDTPSSGLSPMVWIILALVIMNSSKK